MPSTRGFAADSLTAAYYDRRAPEYDDWYHGRGRFADRDRPGWHAELSDLIGLIARMEPARRLDVACGTGFLTRHLPGRVVGIDQSPAMVAIARSRLSRGVALVGDGLALPFAARSFGEVLTGHFYGHLPPDERARFLTEARRVAGGLVVIDAAVRPDVEPEVWQERTLNDGSRHTVFKRYFTGRGLAAEIEGEELFAGDWFVAARTRWRSP